MTVHDENEFRYLLRMLDVPIYALTNLMNDLRIDYKSEMSDALSEFRSHDLQYKLVKVRNAIVIAKERSSTYPFEVDLGRFVDDHS